MKVHAKFMKAGSTGMSNYRQISKLQCHAQLQQSRQSTFQISNWCWWEFLIWFIYCDQKLRRNWTLRQKRRDSESNYLIYWQVGILSTRSISYIVVMGTTVIINKHEQMIWMLNITYYVGSGIVIAMNSCS